MSIHVSLRLAHMGFHGPFGWSAAIKGKGESLYVSKYFETQALNITSVMQINVHIHLGLPSRSFNYDISTTSLPEINT